MVESGLFTYSLLRLFRRRFRVSGRVWPVETFKENADADIAPSIPGSIRSHRSNNTDERARTRSVRCKRNRRYDAS
jgi:hypothetical protein